MILTIDCGTSATKVVLWGDGGPVAVGRAGVETAHPRTGWAEQDPRQWWASVVAASRHVQRTAAAVGHGLHGVQVVALSGARQTFAPVDASGDPVGPGIAWSDRRASAEAASLNDRLGGAHAVRARTGMVLDAEAVAAKVAWLARHRPERLSAAAWLLTPRDLVAHHLTGQAATDRTMASRSGLFDLSGRLVPELAGPAAGLLPPVVGSHEVAGTVLAGAAAQTGFPTGVPVVIGAGDRACEVLGTGAAPDAPMVSWGTTANVSAPVGELPDPVPAGLVPTRGALDGWLLEGGLSAAGSMLSWLGRLTGADPAELALKAADVAPGARGVLALPWLDGARAPWWRDDARAALVGLSSAHDAGDLARAVVEGVALEVQRCLQAMAPARTRPISCLCLAGAGARATGWAQVLTGVTGTPAVGRRSGEAASAGAALLGARAIGDGRTLDDLDPVDLRTDPDPDAVQRYRAWRPRAQRAAEALIGLGLGDETGGPPGEEGGIRGAAAR